MCSKVLNIPKMLVLCALAAPLSLQAASSKSPAPQEDARTQALHVLNRFTFGPRPGDVDAVEQMGVKRWFELQLQPEKIDDSALEQRLSMFPAMRLAQADLMTRFPSQPMLRQITNRNLPLPADPVEHVIYADAVASFQEKKSNKTVAAGAEALGMDMAVVNKTGSPVEVSQLVAMQPDERMSRILAMSPDEWLAFRSSVGPGKLVALGEGMSPAQRETLLALEGPERVIVAEEMQDRMLRDIYSERQLEAVMTDFWLNHFNVYVRKNQREPYLLPAYERDVIRPHALGRFEDLLVAVAESPAMMTYLDNWESIGPDSQAAQRSARVAQMAQNPQVKKAAKDRGLNENYARELMELHTLGVGCEVSKDHPAKMLEKGCGHGYTQQDVTEVAEVLTGWTVDQPERTAGFQFEERRHEPGDKVVMGKKIHEHGQQEGLEVLHMLATSPATARFISTKLAVRFVSDAPPPALVDRMAKAFTKSNGDIRVVLRTMFSSPEFWSPEVYRAKVKTPEEFVISAVRASGAQVTNAEPLVQALDKLGMPLYGMQTPNGYSWAAEPWVNTGDLVNRMNFALALSADKVRGTQTEWVQLMGESADAGAEDAGAKEQRLETILLGQPAQERTRGAVMEQFAAQQQAATAPKAGVVRASVNAQSVAPKQATDNEAAAMGGLLIGSPDFQKR